MQLELSSGSMKKQFFKFVVPCMLTMLLTGLYTIVDGFFIGHAVGDVGLAAIGLVWPIAAVLLALGMGLGVGGSVLMSTFRGAGNHERANQARGNTILLLLAASITATTVLLLFGQSFVTTLGAEGKVHQQAMAYINIISAGGSMQILSAGLTPLIRNSGKTIHAMLIMSSGLAANIILDALLTMVIPLELTGAALATILAEGITVAGSAACLLRQKEQPFCKSQFKPDKSLMVRMTCIGISPFGLSLMPSLITVFNNWQCLAYGGNLAVAAYSVVNYLLASVLLLLEGIGEGMQPLISYCNGAREYTAMKGIRNMGLKFVVCISAVFLLLTIPGRSLLPVFFGTSAKTADIIESALPILCLAFPMMGIGKLFTSYFYACGESLFSNVLIYSDPLVFTPLCIFILPRIWDLTGVWMALPGAQILVMITLGILLALHTKKQLRCNASEEVNEMKFL